MKFFEKHKAKKILGIVCILILLTVLGIYASILATIHEGVVEAVERHELREEDLLSENVPIIIEEQKEPEVFNVMVIGSDSRNPETDSGRSDTMMLVSLNTKTNTASLVSFMRDSYLEIPGYGQTKLGHSYAYGGAGLTINTINQTYGLDVQNYVIVNFSNLVNVIDKIGGIEVPITAEEASIYRAYGHPYIHEGMNQLNGEDALMHAQNRQVDGDFGRTRRQRSVMNGIYRKIMENKKASDLIPLIDYCLTQVKTNMEVSTIYDMAVKVFRMENLVIQQKGIPEEGTYTPDKRDGMSVLLVDVEANKKVIEEFLY